MSRELKEKAIKIQDKDYVLVKDRVIWFNETFENGCIYTELISQPDDERIVVKATAIPDANNPDRRFSDYSQALVGSSFINKTAALENACTSSIGRCLALMGIGVLDSIASVDEIRKAETQEVELPKSDKMKELLTKLIHAEDVTVINEVLRCDDFNHLVVDEKRVVQERAARAVVNLGKAKRGENG